MSILVDKDTRLIVQGLGKTGRFHAELSIAYGTNVVGAVHPSRGGEIEAFDGGVKVPIFRTVEEAMAATEANASVVFVPPAGAADAIMEAAAAGMPLIVTITEGVPVADMVIAKRYLEGKPVRLIGPNCPGVITPDQCRIGIMPGYIHQPGKIGVVSRSGTLTYEAVYQLTRLGLGQTTAVGIGGDPVNGTNFIDVLEEFAADPGTEGVIMIGEIGGTAEEDAADYVAKHMRKPVAGFIAGTTAPPGRRMGHAGAIVSGGKGTAQAKIEAMTAAGINLAPTPTDMGQAMLEALG